MSVNNTNRSWVIVKAGLLVVVAAVQIMAAGTSRAEVPSPKKDIATSADRYQRRLAGTKQHRQRPLLYPARLLG